jgi:hypothetical protein
MKSHATSGLAQSQIHDVHVVMVAAGELIIISLALPTLAQG